MGGILARAGRLGFAFSSQIHALDPRKFWLTFQFPVVRPYARGRRERLWSKVSKSDMQIARLSLFGVNEKCDVLHMPSQAAFGGARGLGQTLGGLRFCGLTHAISAR